MRTSAYEFGASGGWRTVPSLTKTLDISMTLAFFPMLVSHLESPRSSSPSLSPASRHFAHSSPPGLASFQTSHHLKPPSRRLFAGRSCPNRARKLGGLKQQKPILSPSRRLDIYHPGVGGTAPPLLPSRGARLASSSPGGLLAVVGVPLLGAASHHGRVASLWVSVSVSEFLSS